MTGFHWEECFKQALVLDKPNTLKTPTTNHQDHTFSTTTQVSSPNKPPKLKSNPLLNNQVMLLQGSSMLNTNKLLQLLFHVITKYRAHQHKLPHFQSRVLIVISPGWQKRPALTLPGEISSFFFPPNLTKSTSTYEGKSKKMYLIIKTSTLL